jgi:hypothetical protein
LLLHPDKCGAIASAPGFRQAVVLVFDMSDDDSFSVLKAWEGFLSSVDPSIALCVANKADRCSTDAGKLDGKRDVWLEWCLDNGLEFIECSALCDQVGIDPEEGHHHSRPAVRPSNPKFPLEGSVLSRKFYAGICTHSLDDIDNLKRMLVVTKAAYAGLW